MSKRSRRARRKLKAHDRGLDRHNKGLSLIQKQRRQHAERSSQPPRKRDEEAPDAR